MFCMQRQTTTANIWIQEEYALGGGVAGQGDRPTQVTQVPGLLRKGRVASEGFFHTTGTCRYFLWEF